MEVFPFVGGQCWQPAVYDGTQAARRGAQPGPNGNGADGRNGSNGAARVNDRGEERVPESAQGHTGGAAIAA